MINLIVAFIILTVFTILYQAVLQPVLIERLQFKLFRLRDQLRDLKINNSALGNEVFTYLQSSINVSTQLIKIFDFGLMARLAPQIMNNKELIELNERYSDLISKCGVPEVEEIIKKDKEIVVRALMINSFFFLLWFVPVMTILVYPVFKIIISYKELLARFRKTITSFVYTPEPVFARLNRR